MSLSTAEGWGQNWEQRPTRPLWICLSRNCGSTVGKHGSEVPGLWCLWVWELILVCIQTRIMRYLTIYLHLIWSNESFINILVMKQKKECKRFNVSNFCLSNLSLDLFGYFYSLIFVFSPFILLRDKSVFVKEWQVPKNVQSVSACVILKCHLDISACSWGSHKTVTSSIKSDGWSKVLYDTFQRCCHLKDLTDSLVSQHPNCTTCL